MWLHSNTIFPSLTWTFSKWSLSSSSVLVPWFPAIWHPSLMPHDPFGSAIACPVVLRAALRGEESWPWWRCSCKQIPVLTDMEYDAFVAGQGSDSEQMLVVCITSAQNTPPSSPSLSRDSLEQLYRRMNRKRNMPCAQVKVDMSFIIGSIDISVIINDYYHLVSSIGQ